MAQAGVHEQVGDIKKSTGDLVEQVVAFTGAKEATRQHDLVEFDGQGVFAIFDGERYFGHAQGFALAGTGEYHVFHPVAAKGTGALFA